MLSFEGPDESETGPVSQSQFSIWPAIILSVMLLAFAIYIWSI